MDEFFIIDQVVPDAGVEFGDWLEKVNVNITNLYASVYGLMLIHRDDESLPEDICDVFATGMRELERITPNQLYDIMDEDVSTYGYDPESMLSYALRIIDYTIKLDEDEL